ncbi:MAG: DUF3560 domain-containing protein [Planctomycetota bacterium]|jgi:hypothetical protein
MESVLSGEYSATYSPDDNKLRLYASHRLDAETFQRVKAAGFRWAPRQELFVAPAWSPKREDLLLELCGEIGDEDTSLADRAEERAERFAEYQEKRADDADATRQAVAELADGIPLGQPILVGHHSERRARKDAQRIENGMRRAVRLWECSQYWEDRAAGALRHAKYKERPDVRHRRIKKLEAERRKLVAEYTPTDDPPHIISQTAFGDDVPSDHVWVGPKGRGGQWVKLEALPRIEARNARWIAHLDNRLLYERAMLDEQGGTADAKHDIQPGGMVLVRGEWLTVKRVNKSTVTGEVSSVSTNAQYCRVKGVEEIQDYRPPTEERQAAVKQASKLPPLVNYPGDGFQHMTRAKWKRKPGDCKGTQVKKATEDTAVYRYRSAFVPGGSFRYAPVFLTDAKVVYPPKVAGKTEPVTLPSEPDPAAVARRAASAKKRQEAAQDVRQQTFGAMREALRTGEAVKPVSAPQLFETPPELADRVLRF